MPYAPYKPGPAAVAVAALVAAIALAFGIAMLARHRVTLGVVMIAGAIIAAIVAVLSRSH